MFVCFVIQLSDIPRLVGEIVYLNIDRVSCYGTLIEARRKAPGGVAVSTGFQLTLSSQSSHQMAV